MQKNTLLSITLLLSILTSHLAAASIVWTKNTGKGFQYKATENYRSQTATGAYPRFPTLGLVLAAGMDTTCELSLTVKVSTQRQTILNLPLAFSFSDSHVPTGWDNWLPGTTHQCVLNWKHVAKGYFGASLSGNGAGISLGPGTNSIAGHHTGSMHKPEDESCGVIGDEVEGDCATPLIFDMAGDGLSFTGVDIDPVVFDIDGDGEKEFTAWTEADSDDAFLVLDRNENDFVDSANELFGSGTRLFSGEFAANGYEALAELDMKAWGGNEDGLIDKRDAHYRKLLLWIDQNHNGLSEEEEIWRLAHAGNTLINLDYAMEVVKDDYGNLLVYFSNAIRKERGKSVDIQTTDVFFRTLEIE